MMQKRLVYVSYKEYSRIQRADQSFRSAFVNIEQNGFVNKILSAILINMKLFLYLQHNVLFLTVKAITASDLQATDLITSLKTFKVSINTFKVV